MRLRLLHPRIAARNCGHCQLYVYDEATGEATSFRRPPGTFAPCRYGVDRCPKGTPENSRQLSEKNQRAFGHYLQCKAVGRFPDDAVLHRNAGLIRMVEDEIAELRQRELLSRLASLRRISER